MGTDLYALQKGEEHPYVSALLRFSELTVQRMINRNPFMMNDFIYNLTRDGKERQAVLQTMHQFTREVSNVRRLLSLESACTLIFAVNFYHPERD